jgi:putative oxidoreductase
VSRSFPLARFSPELLSVLRIAAAFMFMLHGTGKLFHFPADPSMPPMQLAVGSQPWIAGVLECFGGFLLLIGLFTRPVAFIISGMCAVAYFYAHIPRNFFPFLNGGETVILFSFALLYIAAAGGGAWSADKMWRGTKD